MGREMLLVNILNIVKMAMLTSGNKLATASLQTIIQSILYM